MRTTLIIAVYIGDISMEKIGTSTASWRHILGIWPAADQSDTSLFGSKMKGQIATLGEEELCGILMEDLL